MKDNGWSIEQLNKKAEVDRERIGFMNEEIYQLKFDNHTLRNANSSLLIVKKELERKVVEQRQRIEQFNIQHKQEEGYPLQKYLLEEVRDKYVEAKQTVGYSINFGTQNEDLSIITPMIFSRNPWKLLPGFLVLMREEYVYSNSQVRRYGGRQERGARIAPADQHVFRGEGEAHTRQSV